MLLKFAKDNNDQLNFAIFAVFLSTNILIKIFIYFWKLIN